MSSPWVLGLAASHNGAACLLHGDRVVAAIQEERLTRVKRAPLVPSRPFAALPYVLDTAGIGVNDLDLVVLCPLQSPSSPDNDLGAHPTLAHVPRLTIPHHYGHAMGAYAASGFDDAAICVVDAMGSRVDDLPQAERDVVVGLPVDLSRPDHPGCEARELVSFYEARGGVLRPLEKRVSGHDLFDPGDDHRPRMMSFRGLGVMYMAIAQQIFGQWGDSGKLMGLAPYGQATHPVASFWHLERGLLSFSDTLHEAFRHAQRWPMEREAYADLAASCQGALEQGLDVIWDRLRAASTARRLCYAGGVAMNSVANERLMQSGRFDEVFIMPASEDCGTAIGAAFHGLHTLTGGPSTSAPWTDALGRDRGLGMPSKDTLRDVCERLEAGDVIGWYQGGSEFGPRSLGHRTILFDPRRPEGQVHLNTHVKGREDFRPFAPVVLAEHAERWFDFGQARPESPYMLRVVPVRPEQRQHVPAITHVDGTSRPQTLTRDQGPALYDLLCLFQERTGVPMLLNTSLNVMGEPLVESPEEALACCRATRIEWLVLGERLISTSR
jgi:carbamoyltransferase